MVDRANEIGHNKVFCKKSCDDCDYYRLVRQQAFNVLVVTDNEILVGYIRRSEKSVPFNLEFTDCEYGCSALVEKFRPDFAVIDCSMGLDRAQDMRRHLLDDPRIPHVSVIMAVEPGEYPANCDKDVFAFLEKPFGASDIIECLNSAQEETG
jgi:CheY-like chemotaxis protein